MAKLNKFLSIVLCLTMLTSTFLFTGSVVSAADTNGTQSKALESAGASVDVNATGDDYWTASENAGNFSWDNASVYFLLTDRFYNGNTSNDHSYGRATDADGNPLPGWDTAPGTFHGGDFAGITQEIEAGYFDDLGVNAIWLSARWRSFFLRKR